MAKEWTKGFYQSKAWRLTRDGYYSFMCGKCERCEKELEQGTRMLSDVKPGKIVHHIIELTPDNINDPSVAYGYDNLELVCTDHHNKEHKAKAGQRYGFDKNGNIIFYK
ncbi:HNH endonuclease [Lachnospiraceae bacterium OttesenSCG-928-J05]|nr:HNH endonuclease [Lachnospiraceae bacterium OttesenSCG-928-J05]